MQHGRPRSPRIPNRLWQYRKRMGFSQRQVAAILGHHSPTDVSHYERGAKVPRLVTALKFAVIYRAPVDFLFADTYHRLRAELRAREARLRADWDGHAEADVELAQAGKKPF